MNRPDSAASQYDYIIAGGGAAGLSLLVRMIRSGRFAGKKILLAEKSPKQKNDRTWCFWETGEGLFEEIVYKKWSTLWFHAKAISERLEISPYQYKMIRGIDFYQYCMQLITAQPNITVRYGHISAMHSDASGTWLLLDEERVTAGYIFNSIQLVNPVLGKGEFGLLQHFKGWLIETALPVFKEHEATLMDFRVGQQHGTTFVYVMPFSPTRALVEYTLFSPALLEPADYDNGLKAYIAQYLQCSTYTIAEEEFGIIPMTNYPFPRRAGNIINMGTAGGQTKASSGYTFRFIQKDTAAITAALSGGNRAGLRLMPVSKKYAFYDSVFLNVLATGKLAGDEVLGHLFRNNPSSHIFRFLDNESGILEDIKLISSLPTLPFLKAGIQQLAAWV